MEGNVRGHLLSVIYIGYGPLQGKSVRGSQFRVENASIDQRRKPKDMEWICLIQLRPRKLYKSKEEYFELTVQKPTSRFRSVKDCEEQGTQQQWHLGQCCEPVILQRSCSNSQSETEPQANVHPVHRKRGRLNLTFYQRIESLVKYFFLFW